jgi:hypothetical protein
MSCSGRVPTAGASVAGGDTGATGGTEYEDAAHQGLCVPKLPGSARYNKRAFQPRRGH